MSDFIRSNKLMGVYWIKNNLDKMKITIKLKPPEDILSLPKFEEYANESSSLTLEKSFEEFTFNWQEKIFSRCDMQRYKDVHHCITENELRYNEMMRERDIIPGKVFSYIHEDYYMPLPESVNKKRANVSVSFLNSIMERLGLGETGNTGDRFSMKTDSERHLFKSQEDLQVEDEQWVAMHVVLDHSNYNEETVLLKQEAMLLSIYHNTTHNYVILKPDVNRLDSNPYFVEDSSGDVLGHQYEIQVDFGEKANGEELALLLSKLQKRWGKKHRSLVNFVMPPIGRVHYHLTVSLVAARHFECGNLYVEYDIKLPESLQCKDTLRGRTHVNEATDLEGSTVYHFGQQMELFLEADMSIDPSPLIIYLEAISVDFWHRHRTEGYAHLQITLKPGMTSHDLVCIRPDEKGAEDRRFFLGGCHLLKDLEVLSNPELQNGDYTYTQTGSITVCTALISQSSLPAPSGSEIQYEASTASALLLGAEAALRKYKKARAKLAHATHGPISP